jgi:hypothetical protein
MTPNTGACALGVLVWIVFGSMVGAVAKLVMPGRAPGGLIVTSILGGEEHGAGHCPEGTPLLVRLSPRAEESVR